MATVAAKRKAEQPKSTGQKPTTLAALAPRIKKAHDLYVEGSRKALVHAQEAGQLLIEAKRLCKHGDWSGGNSNGSRHHETLYGQTRLGVWEANSDL